MNYWVRNLFPGLLWAAIALGVVLLVNWLLQ